MPRYIISICIYCYYTTLVKIKKGVFIFFWTKIRHKMQIFYNIAHKEGFIMTESNYEKLLKAASEKLGSTPEQLRKALEKGDIKALSQSLSPSDKEKLRAVLKNKELMQKLKNASPDEIMKTLGK